MKRALLLLITVATAASTIAAAPDSMILYRGAGNWFGSYSISNGFNDVNQIGDPAPVDTFLPSYGFSHAAPMVGDINGDGMDDMVVAQDPGDDGIGAIQWASAHSTDIDSNGEIELSKTTTSSGNFGDATKTNDYFIGDITGDGIQDLIVLRKGGFNWDVRPATTNGISNDAANDQLAQFGTSASDMPIVGDFNGDGMDDVAVWRNNSQTYVSLTAVSNGVGWVGTGATVSGAFGSAVWDIPLVGDINGDGRDDLVVVDVRTNQNSLGWVAAYGQADGQLDYASGHSVIATFGWTNDVPMLADVNGDGMDDMVVVRNGNQWFCAFTGEGGDLTNIVVNTSANFGLPDDIALFGKLKVDGLLPIGDILIEQLAGTNGLALTWFTTAGYNYALESKETLSDANWATNTTVYGIGGDVTVTTAVDQVQSFYRVIGE